MRRTTFDLNCSVARALEVVGEWWTLLIIRDLFFGVTRFDDFQDRLGISRSVLATRLETLTREGIVEARVYDEGRGRSDYVLTKKGRALWPVLVTLRQWGDDWLTGPAHAPVVMEHAGCGPVNASLACEVCGAWLEPGDLRMVSGPGADGTQLLENAEASTSGPSAGSARSRGGVPA